MSTIAPQRLVAQTLALLERDRRCSKRELSWVQAVRETNDSAPDSGFSAAPFPTPAPMPFNESRWRGSAEITAFIRRRVRISSLASPPTYTIAAVASHVLRTPEVPFTPDL